MGSQWEPGRIQAGVVSHTFSFPAKWGMCPQFRSRPPDNRPGPGPFPSFGCRVRHQISTEHGDLRLPVARSQKPSFSPFPTRPRPSADFPPGAVRPRIQSRPRQGLRGTTAGRTGSAIRGAELPPRRDICAPRKALLFYRLQGVSPFCDNLELPFARPRSQT